MAGETATLRVMQAEFYYEGYRPNRKVFILVALPPGCWLCSSHFSLLDQGYPGEPNGVIDGCQKKHHGHDLTWLCGLTGYLCAYTVYLKDIANYK